QHRAVRRHRPPGYDRAVRHERRTARRPYARRQALGRVDGLSRRSRLRAVSRLDEGHRLIDREGASGLPPVNSICTASALLGEQAQPAPTAALKVELLPQSRIAAQRPREDASFETSSKPGTGLYGDGRLERRGGALSRSAPARLHRRSRSSDSGWIRSWTRRVAPSSARGSGENSKPRAKKKGTGRWDRVS